MAVLNPIYQDSGGGTGNISSKDIETIVVMDKEDYKKLPVKDPKTLYLIKG